jgi:hypothetical protein
MSWEMAEVYGAITDQILINLAHYFPYYNARNFPRSSITYQADMLAQMGQVNKETMAIIRRNLVGCDKYLNAALEQVIVDSVQAVNPTLWGAVKKGIFMPPTRPVLAPNQYRAFNLYYTQAANKLNLVNTVMLESTQQAYRATVADIAARVQATQTALDIGAGEVVTGVSSWNTATAHAINRMKQNGITGFIDHGGHRWSAEAYVAMDIRTTMYNTGRAAVWETNQNFGNDLYQVSYHNGARPLCYPWQSKVISSTDNARTVADLDGNEVHVYAQSETSYGEAAGLFGINCKHYPTPFIPGVSIVREGGQDEEANSKTYEESQQQRAMERKIREEKRDLLMLKEQGAPDDLIKAQRAKIRQTDDEIDDFCNATGRARRQNREGVYTKREFPAADTYDPATFVDDQKRFIEEYYNNGGAQQNYTFGQMTPNAITPLEPQIAPEEPAINPDIATFNPAKTRTEAEAYAQGLFAENVDYKGMSLANANKVNETLSELTQKYPITRLEELTQHPQGSVARANYRKLEINGKKLGKVLEDEEMEFKVGKAFIRHEIKTLQERYAGKAKIPFAIENKITTLEKKLQFTRYGVHSTYDDHVKVVITHEYGHILSDQYFGMLNSEKANPHYDTNWSLRGMSQKWREAYEKALDNGDIYTLSEYGSKNPREFFAESFAAREMGEKLPDYVESLLEEVLNNGIM